MQYRRAKMGGGTYFFTVVTYRRAELFSYPENIELLRRVFLEIVARHRFTRPPMEWQRVRRYE